MAKDESDFQKLLSEAPMAPSADTVTVVGVLARTADAARFMLTLPDGRSVTLDVDAVKSAKPIAGAIGQTVVQLELDPKHVPENLRPVGVAGWTGTSDLTGILDSLGAVANKLLPSFDQTGLLDVSGLGDVVSFPQGWGGFANLVSATPFVAAMAHQADPATMMALAQRTTTTYYSVIPNLDVASDPQPPLLKTHSDPQAERP